MYNHIDPIEKQVPLLIEKRNLPKDYNFGVELIEKYVSIPMVNGDKIILKLLTDSEHMATFFVGNWPEVQSREKVDGTIISLKKKASDYGLSDDLNLKRWYCPDTQQVWFFDTEFY